MKFFTIGYGGRTPTALLDLLRTHGVRTVVDVRATPQRAYLGVFSKQKNAASGIEGLLAREGVAYLSLPELGNPLRELGSPLHTCADWRERYGQFLRAEAQEHLQQLRSVAAPFALLCAEKKAADCHREPLATFLIECWGTGEVEHL